jgi:Tol biopolymer transport system component
MSSSNSMRGDIRERATEWRASRTKTLIRTLAVLLVAAALTSACGHEQTRPPGGRFLVYTRHPNSGQQALWIARVDDTHPRLLVRHRIFGALSPDGRWVAYNKCLASQDRCQTGNAPFALFLIATSGATPRLLARSMAYPTWSPRSDRIVALRKNTLVSIDLEGNSQVLEKNPATAGWSFSPDGKWIVYAKVRQHTKCASDLFIVHASGGEERRLTRGRDIFPVWGRHWIAFSRYPKTCAYARRIWRVRTDGSDAQPVTGPRRRATAGAATTDSTRLRGHRTSAYSSRALRPSGAPRRSVSTSQRARSES